MYRDSSFWTSGFFPGILYQLLSQRRKTQFFTGAPPDQQPHLLKLEYSKPARKTRTSIMLIAFTDSLACGGRKISTSMPRCRRRTIWAS